MSEWSWIDTLTRQFELCRATGGRDVVVVGETTTPPQLLDTVTIALQRTGANASVIVLPVDHAAATRPGSVAAALAACDFVIDCTMDGLSPVEATDILVLGSRSPAGIERFVPHPGLEERVDRAVSLFRGGETAAISSGGGTSLIIPLGPAVIDGSFGCPTPNRRVERWPAGFVRLAFGTDEDHDGLNPSEPSGAGQSGGSGTATDADKSDGGKDEAAKSSRSKESRARMSASSAGHSRAKGKEPRRRRGAKTPTAADGPLVLMPGDVNPTMREFIHSPVTLELEHGRICEIVGDSGDADIIRAYLEADGTPDAYRLNSIVIGLNQHVTASHPFDRTPLTDGLSHLWPGQVTFDFGSRGDAGDPLISVGLRTATVQLGTVIAVDEGVLAGELAPDVYERATHH